MTTPTSTVSFKDLPPAKMQAVIARSIERAVRKIVMEEGADRSLAWVAGFTAALDTITKLAAMCEQKALQVPNDDQHEWQKMTGLLMEHQSLKHVHFETEWLRTFNQIPESEAKVLIAHERDNGLHVMLLPPADAHAYAALCEQGEL